MLNKSEEDYIKYIYENNAFESGAITIKEIAQFFSYTEQSVHEMIKKLEKKQVLKYQPYKGLKLTQKGKKEALRMIRSHRLWERFLGDYLGYDWDEVHEEAEKLEHASSEQLLKRLYQKLGNPTHCQHGNPIPDFNNEVVLVNDTPLSKFKSKEPFTITRIQDYKPLLNYLSKQDIQLNDQLYILENDEFQELLVIKQEGKEPFTISYKIAHMIHGS
jgi:DtxR family Mn-dependent transcriptional regulator